MSPKHYDFARDDVFPSWWTDAIQEFLSAAWTDLRLTRLDATTVQVAPAEPYGIAALPIQGRWRYRTVAVNRAISGTAGTKSVWAVALDNDVVHAPQPHTDNTDYSFDLRVTAGEDPSGAGVEIFEKIGEVGWDGAAITVLEQIAPQVHAAMLAPGVVQGSSRISVTRGPGGSFLLDLVSDSVGAAQIGPGAVGTGELGNLVVTLAKMAANSVDASKIVDGSVTNAKIGDVQVTLAKMAGNSVDGSKIVSGGVGTSELADLGVTLAKMAANSVDASKIVDGTMGPAELATAAKNLFPQLASAANRILNFGTFPIATDENVTKTVAVAHGLGKTPVAVLATAHDARANAAALAYTTTNFDCQIRHVEANSLNQLGPSVTVAWLAIG